MKSDQSSDESPSLHLSGLSGLSGALGQKGLRESRSNSYQVPDPIEEEGV